ncbi:hypothetical protein [Actinomadura parmotrematis]|uniref:DUF3558 domain-containing protein n=1 Tax=Actinomadura parmotrematis TaxID=2864039 RepID=A0ABS7FQV1_9ACTN|nr:hypothetical protein [Actinomadura parmotrematis]MBW8482780.1 hypothetical protein [Actinomadura parmotrematis]
MRPRLPAAALAVLLAAGCGGTGNGTGAGGAGATSEPPPLAQASPTPLAAPSNTRTPGPAVTKVCALAGAALVASALKTPTRPRARETAHPGGARSCRYQYASTWVEMWAVLEPARRSPDLTVQAVIGQYTGTLEKVPGLGDAALYAGGSAANAAETLAVARLEGTRMRTITLSAFLDGHNRDGLAAIARTALERS